MKKKNKLYILSILDHFSKFSANFIIKNKDKITVLNKIKKFIEKYGAPDKILTDNGGEFINNEFKKFCKKLHIQLLHGRPHHPQTQGAVERYNRTIKDLLKNRYLELEYKGYKFILSEELEKAIEIYNNSKHSSTGFIPKDVFFSKDKNLFKKIKENTLLSQKYKKINIILLLKMNMDYYMKISN